MSDDDFDKKFYNGTILLDEFDVTLSFKDDYQIEKATFDFLDTLGFRITDAGYKYLTYIIKESMKLDKLDISMKFYYECCSQHYGVTPKSVETAIGNAIKTAGKTGKLSKMNEIFGVELVDSDSISNGMFISAVCGRFNMNKRYDREIKFQA